MTAIPHSAFVVRRPPVRSGFTVLELLTTIALFVVVMGLMVSLARYVRSNSADQLTRAILIDLERDMAFYHARYNAYPPANAPASEIDEKTLAKQIESDAPAVARLLAMRDGPIAPSTTDAAATPSGPDTIRDAWGRTIGYLPYHHPLVGMAPQNRPFFFSAGPDGLYLTRQDNLYSYEQSRPGQSPDLPGVDNANNPRGGE